MGSPISELFLQTILRQGLDSLTTDPEFYVNEIFSGYSNPIFGADGLDSLKQIKDFFSALTGDNLDIAHGFPTDLKAPNIISIFLLSTVEDNKQALGDRWESANVPSPRRIIVDNFTADEFDENNSIIRVNAADYDLHEVWGNHLMKDEKGNLFKIAEPPLINMHDQWEFTLNVQPGEVPSSLSNLQIVSPVDFKAQQRGSIWYWETLGILIQAQSYQKCYWMYLAVAYILQSLKKTLEENGFEISKFNARDLSRDQPYDPEFVVSRQIDLTWRIQYTFIQGSSLVPDVLKLHIAPSRKDSGLGILSPTVEQVESDIKDGKPSQTLVAKFNNDE